MTVSLKPLSMPLEAFLSLSLKPSVWTFIRLTPVVVANHEKLGTLTSISFG